MEKQGEEETSEQAQVTDCAEESPKGETGEGGIKQSGEGKERGCCGNVECADLGCEGREDGRSSRARDGCSNAYNKKVCRGFPMPTPEASKTDTGGRLYGFPCALERGEPQNIS